MVPMNFLAGESGAANYVLTGTCGKGGLKEASRLGSTHIAWDGSENDIVACLRLMRSAFLILPPMSM